MWGRVISNIRQRLRMKPRIATEESYLLYQNLCDNVFGVGVVKIKPASSNNIIGTLNDIGFVSRK